MVQTGKMLLFSNFIKYSRLYIISTGIFTFGLGPFKRYFANAVNKPTLAVKYELQYEVLEKLRLISAHSKTQCTFRLQIYREWRNILKMFLLQSLSIRK